MSHVQNHLYCIPLQTSVNPRSEEQIESEASKRQQQQLADLESKEDEEGGPRKTERVEVASDSLVNQDFLMDPDKTVGEVLIESGIEVKDFVRFEIGKGIEVEE